MEEECMENMKKGKIVRRTVKEKGLENKKKKIQRWKNQTNHTENMKKL